MTIEVYYKGKRIRHEYVNIPGRNIGVPFETYVKNREEIVNNVLQDFIHNKLERIYRNDPNVQIAIVFHSRLSEIQETEAVKKKVAHIREPEPAPFVRPKAEYTNQRSYDL